jgi:phosphatidylserine/phosphatidylglycerophosphate/cardiolipin synthase-like enzyme
MTKKRSSSKSSKSSQKRNPILSFITTLLTGIVVIVAVIITQATGIDLTGLLGVGTPAATSSTLSTPIPVTVPANPAAVTPIQIGQGFGAAKGFWQVYFTAPTGSSDAATYVNGIDYVLAQAINGVQRSLDIVAFEWNSPILTQAVLAAKQRGVTVRMVADNEHTRDDEDSTISQLASANIPIVYDNRSAFMHNKFMILDGSIVWTGSTNYTVNDVYRNNNNMIALRSRRAVETYQTEFNEMFQNASFGPRSPATNTANFTQDGIPLQIYFAPENQVIEAIMTEVNGARTSVRFLAFSFTYDDLGELLLQRAGQGVRVEGIFELRGSETEFSELRHLFCGGLDVRQDGNRFTLHHKVFIIDNLTVITGSFNFSQNAVDSNDENLVIIKDPDLATQYIAEYERLKTRATKPSGLTCN